MSELPPSGNPPASAAAMDALDLDDLFLDGDEDGVGDGSLFADMEIDLGDMGSIFDATTSNKRAISSGDVMTQEFGRQSFSSISSAHRGKRVRTSKTNPHLLAAELDGDNKSAAKRMSAIQKELHRLQESNETNTHAKRKRRRSKKTLEDDDSREEATATSSYGKAATKKKRRNSSKTNIQLVDSPAAATAPLEKQPHLQHALQQIFHPMNPHQQQRLQKKLEGMGLNIFESSSNVISTLQSHSLRNITKKQNKIGNFGLQPSSTVFFPYMTLPSELDIKRGLKSFPILEKINAISVPSHHHNHNNNTSDSNPADENQPFHSISTSANITDSSPLYALFHQHLGLIQKDEKNNDKGISDLDEARKFAHNSIEKDDRKKKVAQELSKLLILCLKQSGFIMQNLLNLEGWVKGGGGGCSIADIQTLFPDKISVAGSAVTATPSRQGLANAPTHGGPNATPIISLRVRVRVSGWREKSGAKLTARLWCPLGWKVAMNRASLKYEAKLKASLTNAPSPASTTTPKSTASRKRKVKESTTVSVATNRGVNVVNQDSSSKIIVPFVSGHDSDLQHQKVKQQHQEHQDSSIIHTLYTKILRPSTSPTQRRELLANEISSALSRLESARLTHQWTKARKLQMEMKALRSVYKDDIDIVPDLCNTIGLWRWMDHTNYFKEIDEAEDVFQELEEEEEEKILESKERVVLDEDLRWDTSELSKVRRVLTASDGIQDEEEAVGLNDDIESSPLFDRLQSLLVEVDGSDDDDDDDNDDLIASLPPFSSGEFIHGPSGNNDVDENDLIDVSALNLDQRTFIQLCAVGLADAATSPSYFLKRTLASSSTSFEEGESIGFILQKMLVRLKHLQTDRNVKVADLQRKALLQVKQAQERKQRERDEDAVLTKYKQLQKIQEERGKEKYV